MLLLLLLIGCGRNAADASYQQIINMMQGGAMEKTGGFIETVTAKPEPEPPNLPEESRCKVDIV